MANKDISIKLNFDSNGQVVMGKLTVSAKDLQKAVTRANRSIKGSFAGVTASLANLHMAFQGLTSSIQGLSQPYMEFDKAMRIANTMAGKNAKEFEQLKNQVKALSKEVPVARDALANGLYQVISNGVPESNWISFLQDSAKASVGGVADLGEVVKVTSTIIKNYGLSWEDAGHVQDMIQLTAKNGVTSFEQLAQALPRVATNAAKLGISTGELMASVSTLTGVTGNTHEVATQMAAVLTALVKPSSEAQKMARAMGMEFNAASIKSAGGLQNFLVTLNKAVQEYATANNVLAEEVYGKLFGSAESLRALGALTGQLSGKFNENVAAMQDASGTIDAAFAEMEGSAQSSSQIVSNYIDNMIDSIGKYAAAIYPAIQYTANLGLALNGLGAMGKGIKSLFTGMPKILRKAALGMQMLALSSRTASIAVKTLTLAIKSLMTVTAIGLIIVAITSIVDAFTNSVDESAEAVNEAKKEYVDWKKSLTDMSSAVEQASAKELSSLERLYKAATEETKSREERMKAANELQKVYKDTFGGLKTEAILAGKAADAYIKLRESILATATARAAQSMIESNKGQWIKLDIERKQLSKELKDNAEAEKSATADYEKAMAEEHARAENARTSFSSAPSLQVDPTSAFYREAVPKYHEIKDAQDARRARLAEINTQQSDIDKANSDLTPYTEVPESVKKQFGNSLDDILDNDKSKDKTLKQRLEGLKADALDRYTKAEQAGNEEVAASQKKLIDGYNLQLKNIDLIEKKAERPATLSSLEDINAEIQYQQALRQHASADNIAAVDAEIARLEEMRKAYEKQTPIKDIDQIKTYEELDRARQYYSDRMQTASAEERIEIQKILNKLQELSDSWGEVLAEVSAPGDLSALDTPAKLAKAMSYYQAKLENASAEEAYGIQRTIGLIKEKQSLMQRGVSLADMQTEADSINKLSGKEQKAKINDLGYDGISDRIATLKAMLNDTENPMAEAQREQIEDLIAQYERWQSIAGDTYGKIAKGLSLMGQSFGSLSEVIGGAVGAWLDYAGKLMGSISQLIPAIQAVAMANAVNSAAQTPVIGWLEVGAAAMAVIAAFASLPKFAEGGIAYGPTMGLFGEYPGASNNPEVVAPLNKLRTLIQPAGFDGGRVEFEIDGTKLRGVLSRVEKRSRRS